MQGMVIGKPKSIQFKADPFRQNLLTETIFFLIAKILVLKQCMENKHS